MKPLATTHTVGVDVSKLELEMFELETDTTVCIPNTIESIELWLDRWASPIRLAIEPTNRYHHGGAARPRPQPSGLYDRSTVPGALPTRGGTTREGRSSGRATGGALSRT